MKPGFGQNAAKTPGVKRFQRHLTVTLIAGGTLNQCQISWTIYPRTVDNSPVGGHLPTRHLPNFGTLLMKCHKAF